MKRVWISIGLLLCFISVTNILKLLQTNNYNTLMFIIIILFEIVSNIFLALYLALLFNEFIINKIFKCKLLSSYKLTRFTNFAAMLIYIILYFGKNMALLYYIPIYFIMLFYVLTQVYSFVAITTKINNIYK